MSFVQSCLGTGEAGLYEAIFPGALETYGALRPASVARLDEGFVASF